MSESDLPLYHIQTAGRRNEGTSFLPSGYSVMTFTFSKAMTPRFLSSKRKCTVLIKPDHEHLKDDNYSKMDERCVYLHEMYGMETAKRCPHCIERVYSEGHVVNEQTYYRPGFRRPNVVTKEYQVCRQICVQDSPPFQKCALSVKPRST